jgi:hypothetical protein
MLHTDLPIFAQAYQLLDLTIDLAANLPRKVKLLVGTKLQEDCLAVADLIRRANIAQGETKTPHLSELVGRLQSLELLFRTSRDKRFISTGQYARAIQITGSIGRQANAWRKKFSPVA